MMAASSIQLADRFHASMSVKREDDASCSVKITSGSDTFQDNFENFGLVFPDKNKPIRDQMGSAKDQLVHELLHPLAWLILKEIFPGSGIAPFCPQVEHFVEGMHNGLLHEVYCPYSTTFYYQLNKQSFNYDETTLQNLNASRDIAHKFIALTVLKAVLDKNTALGEKVEAALAANLGKVESFVLGDSRTFACDYEIKLDLSGVKSAAAELLGRLANSAAGLRNNPLEDVPAIFPAYWGSRINLNDRSALYSVNADGCCFSPQDIVKEMLYKCVFFNEGDSGGRLLECWFENDFPIVYNEETMRGIFAFNFNFRKFPAENLNGWTLCALSEFD
jgi:hypothetical protein